MINVQCSAVIDGASRNLFLEMQPPQAHPKMRADN
jgi:hypothetical protein